MKLRVMHPAIGTLIVPLEASGLVVGREGGHADLEMNWDRRVSRRHTRFWIENGVIWFQDLGSRNGTWDRDRRVDMKEPLTEERSILVGETSFSVAIAGAAETSADIERIDEMLQSGDLYTETTDAFGRLPTKEELEGPQIIIEDIPVPDLPPPRSRAPEPAAPEPGPDLPPPRPRSTSKSRPVTSNAVLIEEPPPPPPPPPRAPPPPPPPAPKVVAPPPVRAFPRFASERKVALKIGERDELRTLWTENISKGGLYVRSEGAAPSRGTIVEVMITTPDGELKLNAEVVHVVDAAAAKATGQTAGVGLQFVNLTPDARAAIHRYVDGIAPRLDSTSGAGPAPKTERVDRAAVEKTLARAKEFMAAVEDNKLYKALEVDPKATADQIQAAVNELARMFSEAERSATPPQLARLQAARKLLDRTTTLMCNAERRLEYDFRAGDVRAEERLALAKQKRGPAATELRGTWHRALPGRLEKALELLRQAIAAKKARQLIEAVRLGRAALELDPFHEELRQTVDAWSKQVGPEK